MEESNEELVGEPFEPRKNIDPSDWKKFLPEFAFRNNGRRARFEVFRPDGEVEEEAKEASLDDLEITQEGDDLGVVVIRIDHGDAKAEKLRDRIHSLRGVAVQFEPDGSEGAIEFTDKYEELITLRMESRIDGAS